MLYWFTIVEVSDDSVKRLVMLQWFTIVEVSVASRCTVMVPFCMG